MDWTDFIFPAKHVLNQAAGSQGPSNPAQGSSQTLDIAKMAQDQADSQKIPKMGQPGTAPQPTMQQLKGMGGNTPCPTCGK